eukprot:jgi/Tetstr1/440034/TSEL_028393.t2
MPAPPPPGAGGYSDQWPALDQSFGLLSPASWGRVSFAAVQHAVQMQQAASAELKSQLLALMRDIAHDATTAAVRAVLQAHDLPRLSLRHHTAQPEPAPPPPAAPVQPEPVPLPPAAPAQPELVPPPPAAPAQPEPAPPPPAAPVQPEPVPPPPAAPVQPELVPPPPAAPAPPPPTPARPEPGRGEGAEVPARAEVRKPSREAEGRRPRGLDAMAASRVIYQNPTADGISRGLAGGEAEFRRVILPRGVIMAHR